jgi:hypothetical protein
MRSASRLKHALKGARDDAEVRCARLALLRHSLRMSHGRLLLKRLQAALDCGADLTADDIDQCLACLLEKRDYHINQGLLRMSRELSQP